jgi:hypothetical protein
MFAILFSISTLLTGCGTGESTVKLVPTDPKLEPVQWMAGSWISEDADHNTIVEEHWTQPAGGTMLGVNRTISNGKAVFFENLRIETTPSGIVYLASPKGRQPPTPFHLVESSPFKQMGRGRVVFENKQHDNPQRIIYERHGDLMRGRTEGVEDGKPVAEEWVWRRARIE